MTTYCKDCKRNITPKGAKPIVLIIMVVFAFYLLSKPIISSVLWGFFMLMATVVYFFVTGRTRCPICNGRNLKEKKKKKNV